MRTGQNRSIGSGLFLFLSLLLLTLHPVRAWSIEDPGAGIYHMIGLGAGYETPALNIQDGYYGAIRETIFYELHGIIPDTPVSLAGAVSFNALIPNEGLFFFSSHMFEVSGLLQLDFPVHLSDTIIFQPTPYAGYKHYFRYHLYEDKESRNNRPVLLSGIKLKLVISQKDFVELNVEYNLALDNKPVHLLAFVLGMGPVFR